MYSTTWRSYLYPEIFIASNLKPYQLLSFWRFPSSQDLNIQGRKVSQFTNRFPQRGWLFLRFPRSYLGRASKEDLPMVLHYSDVAGTPTPWGHSQAGEAVGRPDLSRNSPGWYFQPAPRPQRSLLEPPRPPTRWRHHPGVGRARMVRPRNPGALCAGAAHARRPATLPAEIRFSKLEPSSGCVVCGGSRGCGWGGFAPGMGRSRAMLLHWVCSESWTHLQEDEIEQPRQSALRLNLTGHV